MFSDITMMQHTLGGPHLLRLLVIAMVNHFCNIILQIFHCCMLISGSHLYEMVFPYKIVAFPQQKVWRWTVQLWKEKQMFETSLLLGMSEIFYLRYTHLFCKLHGNNKVSMKTSNRQSLFTSRGHSYEVGVSCFPKAKCKI